VAPNICGRLVWNLLHVTDLSPINFEVAPRFLENVRAVDLKTFYKIRQDMYEWREVTWEKAVMVHLKM
jgi:hypothetical protein